MASDYLHGPVDYCKMHGQLVFAAFASFFSPLKCGVVCQNQTSPVRPHLVEVDILSFFCLRKLLGIFCSVLAEARERQVRLTGPPLWGRTATGVVSITKLRCSFGCYFLVFLLEIVLPGFFHGNKALALLNVLIVTLCLSCKRNSRHPTVFHFYESQGNCYD